MLILTWAAAGSGCEDAATGAPARNLAKKIFDCQRMEDYFKAPICQNITLIRGTWGFTVARLRTATDTLIMGCDSTAQFWVKKPRGESTLGHKPKPQSNKGGFGKGSRHLLCCHLGSCRSSNRSSSDSRLQSSPGHVDRHLVVDHSENLTLFSHFCSVTISSNLLHIISLSNKSFKPMHDKKCLYYMKWRFFMKYHKSIRLHISRHWFRTERHYNSRYHTQFLSSVSLATEQVSKTKSIINDLIYFFADSSVFFGGHYSNFWEPAIYFAFLPNHPPPLLPLLPPEKSIVNMIHMMIKNQWFGIYQPEALRARPRSPLVPWVPPQAYRLLTRQGFCQLRPEVKIIEWLKYWTLHSLFNQQL